MHFMKARIFAALFTASLLLTPLEVRAQAGGGAPPAPAPSPWSVGDDGTTLAIGWDNPKDIVINNPGGDEVVVIITNEKTGDTQLIAIAPNNSWGETLPADHTFEITDKEIDASGNDVTDDGNSTGASGTWSVV